MGEVIERETVNETIEATVNYVRTTARSCSPTPAGPARTDVRTGGTVDPQRGDDPQRPAARRALHARPQRLPLRAATTPRSTTSSTTTRSRSVYYPEMEALVKAESGAKRVVVFDHTLRTADDELREKT